MYFITGVSGCQPPNPKYDYCVPEKSQPSNPDSPNIEAGRQRISFEQVQRIAEALCVPPGALLPAAWHQPFDERAHKAQQVARQIKQLEAELAELRSGA